MEEDLETLKQIRELRMHPGWNKLQDHLGKLLINREKVKAGRLREYKPANYEQGFIDGIKVPAKELEKLLSQSVNDKLEEEGQLY